MRKSEGSGRPEPASEDDQSGPSPSPELAATKIERDLRGLVGVAEEAELRFLGYLLRMALLEAGGVQYRRAQ